MSVVLRLAAVSQSETVKLHAVEVYDYEEVHNWRTRPALCSAQPPLAWVPDSIITKAGLPRCRRCEAVIERRAVDERVRRRVAEYRAERGLPA